MSNGAHKLGFRGWLAIMSSLATIVATILAILTFANPFITKTLLPSELEQQGPTPTNQGIPQPTLTLPPTPAAASTSAAVLELGTATPPAPTATMTSVPDVDTATPDVAQQPTPAPVLKYPSPELLGPPDGYPVGWKSGIVLKWRAVGPLAEDEYCHLHLDAYRRMDNAHWYGDYLFTKDTTVEIAPGFFSSLPPT